MRPATKNLVKWVSLLAVISVAGGCYPTLKREAERADQALVSIRFFLPNFRDDMEFDSLLLAIQRNLAYLARLDAKEPFQYGPDTFTCQEIRETQEAFFNLVSQTKDPVKLAKIIKKHFRVYRAAGRPGNSKVLFTGYFEPVFEASLTPDETYRFPLYRKPDDLIKIDLSLFGEKFKGNSIVARIDGNKVGPYYSRYEIEVEKALHGKGLEIAWLKDPVDVTFLHIQGSGRLNLPNGESLSVGYEAANGQPYRSIGRYMLEREYLTPETMSMQNIRRFLAEHPELTDEILNQNPSYVFFRILENGPLGNISVPLTPGRSIALDARLFPKGALAFISCQKPVVNDRGEILDWVNFSRFVLNQDTGGAIRGAGRADLFWGSGDYAEIAAGHLKHEGELYILVKKP